MQNKLDRIHQFMPFDSLNSIENMTSFITNNKDNSYLLNKSIKELRVGDKVLIKFYYDLDYYESMGIITKLDNKYIYFMESKIDKEDIIGIEYI